MKTIFRRFAVFFLCLLACTVLCVRVSAEEAPQIDIKISGSGYDSFRFLTDGNITRYTKSSGSCTLNLKSEEANIASLYLMFNLDYGDYTVTNNDTGDSFTAGTYGFLHEYLDLTEAFGGPVQSLTIRFENGIVRLSEIFGFGQGELPDFVQQWEPPLENETDILLLATHGDDDQLFFAGLFPLYAAERGYNVQVVYLTDHRNITYKRTHEMLNGLWQTGITHYPVFGGFDDFLIESLEGTYAEYEELGTSREELLGYVVEQLRRFKPQVVVGHDFAGEYGHGMHMVYTDLLVQALEISNDASAYPELADRYGLWDVPKTYIHLYEENPIVIDYDTPLEAFDGLTAFQVTQKYGYPCHESQWWTWFTDWINGKENEITKATQIETYNPCLFGLYRSTVGADTAKNDFMENITCYAELQRLEQERLEQERLEQERLEQERLEQERLEQERLEQERLEQERLEQAQIQEEQEQTQIEQERHEQQAARQRKLILLLACLVFCVISAVILIARIAKSNTGKFSKKR